MSPLYVDSPSPNTSSPEAPYFERGGRNAPADAHYHEMDTISRPLDSPPHRQGYYDRQWFRLLVALIFIVSLIEAAYGTYYSLLYDIEFAYLAWLLSVTFSVVEVLLWAVIGVLCMHVNRAKCQWLHNRTSSSRSEGKSLLRLLGWTGWIVMLAANVGLKVYLDYT